MQKENFLNYLKISIMGVLIMIIASGLIVRAEAATVTDEELGYTYSKDGNVTSAFPILRAIVNIENYEASEKTILPVKPTVAHWDIIL